MRDYYTLVKDTSTKDIEFVGNLTHIEPNDITILFFSDDNIKFLNNELINTIRNITFQKYGKYIVIQPQRKHTMVAVMRYVYFKNVKNRDIARDEVDKLNRIAIKIMVQKALFGLVSYIKYLNDYNESYIREPLANPQSTSIKTLIGQRTMF